MDQDSLLAAITNQLDSLESLTNAGVLLAVVAAWAGVRNSPEVEVLGTKIERRYAFGVLAAVFLMANGSILIHFLRLGDVLALLDQAHIRAGVTRMVTHSWILNPFAHFADAGLSRALQTGSIGLLVVVWWLCNTALWLLLGSTPGIRPLVLLGVFFMIGLGVLAAINRATVTAVRSLGALDSVGATQLGLALRTDWLVGVLGALVGFVIFRSATQWQRRLLHES